jgi:hypothetical protein
MAFSSLPATTGSLIPLCSCSSTARWRHCCATSALGPRTMTRRVTWLAELPASLSCAEDGLTGRRSRLTPSWTPAPTLRALPRSGRRAARRGRVVIARPAATTRKDRAQTRAPGGACLGRSSAASSARRRRRRAAERSLVSGRLEPPPPVGRPLGLGDHHPNRPPRGPRAGTGGRAYHRWRSWLRRGRRTADQWRRRSSPAGAPLREAALWLAPS